MGDRAYHLERWHYAELFLTCSDCGKVFSRKDHLKDHKLLAHSPDPPEYKCDQCGRSFKQKQHLTRHVKEVHKGRIIECPYCKTTFSRQDKMDKHLKKCDVKLAKKNV